MARLVYILLGEFCLPSGCEVESPLNTHLVQHRPHILSCKKLHHHNICQPSLLFTMLLLLIVHQLSIVHVLYLTNLLVIVTLNGCSIVLVVDVLICNCSYFHLSILTISLYKRHIWEIVYYILFGASSPFLKKHLNTIMLLK